MDVISVIVPVYGVEKYIEKCINSILNSTYKNLEILVVNDGSKDCSKDIVFNIASSSLYEVVNDNISNKFDADKLNSIVRVNVNKFNEYSKDIYVKIPSTLLNSYFSYLDCLAQEIIYNEAILSNSSYFSIDEFGNFEPCDNLNVNDLFDNAVFEIRAKSYSFSSGLSNIKYIEHFNNLGLYQARLTGYEYATGKYITSIDSDDYIGIDYIRMLWKTAEETDADVVISEMVRENSKAGYKSKRTHAMNAIHGLDLHGREIPDYLFESEGELSPLWFVCGKLYKKTLWDKCYPFLSSVSGHHIMLEDMMYGTVFSTNASHYVYCDVDTYFYVVNDNASTTNNGSSEKLKKNIDDVLYAFEFIENYIRKRGLYNRYKNSFKKFKEKWSRTWYDIQADYLLTQLSHL